MLRLCKELKISWPSIKKDLQKYKAACPVCQKLNMVTDARPIQQHHRTTFEPFSCIAIDTLGPLPEDDHGNKYVLVCIDEFSKFLELFPIKTTSAQEAATCLLQLVGRYGCPREIMSDQGSQFKNQLISQLCTFFEVRQRFSLPYRPQANGIVERSNREILKHLRAIIMDKKVLRSWSIYLPLVQRIINASFHRSIGTCPMRLLFGDFLTVDRGIFTDMDINAVRSMDPTTSVNQYIEQLNEQLYDIISASQLHQQSEWEKIKTAAGPKEFQLGDYVLVTYPSQRPQKLSSLLRGPLLVVGKHGNNYDCLDIISNRVVTYDVSRLFKFLATDALEVPTEDAARDLNLADRQEFEVDFIVEHKGTHRRKRDLQFRIRWVGYPPEEDTWLPYSEVKELAALDAYLREHRELNLPL